MITAKADCGLEIVGAFTGLDQAVHVIAKHPGGTFTIGYFYDPASGIWKSGTYGFPTADDAVKHLTRSRCVHEVTVSSILGTEDGPPRQLDPEQIGALESYAKVLDEIEGILNSCINAPWISKAQEILGPHSDLEICRSVVSLRNRITRVLDGEVVS